VATQNNISALQGTKWSIDTPSGDWKSGPSPKIQRMCEKKPPDVHRSTLILFHYSEMEVGADPQCMED
jgi:hypothetical protein